MKITYRGDCEEMYGQEIEVPDHECRDHAEWSVEECVDTHGLECGPYERWREERWICSICKQDVE